MTPMLEKAAKALCEVQGYKPTENEMARAMDEVCAVLKAIREPDKEVLSAGYVVSEEMPFIGDEAVWREMSLIWQSMIDTILGDEG